MESYATVEELEGRWRVLSDVEKVRAEVLLLDASVLVASMCKESGVTIDPDDEVQELTIKSVVCSVVKRAMLAPVDEAPMSNYSQTAGSYSESGTYVNPTGDLYLTSSESSRLGLGRQKLFAIQPTGGVADD